MNEKLKQIVKQEFTEATEHFQKLAVFADNAVQRILK